MASVLCGSPRHRELPPALNLVWPYASFSPIECDRSDTEQGLSLSPRDHDASAIGSCNPDVSI